MVERVGGQHIENDMVPKLTSPLKRAKMETEKPKAVERKVTTASKKRTARIIFSLVILPLFITTGWFAAPYISSRLPAMPVFHSLKNGIVAISDRVFQAKVETEAVLDKEASKVKVAMKKTKVKAHQKVKDSKKTINDAVGVDEDSGGYLAQAQNILSSWFDQIAGLFGGE